jgi:hypothetical protein
MAGVWWSPHTVFSSGEPIVVKTKGLDLSGRRRVTPVGAVRAARSAMNAYTANRTTSARTVIPGQASAEYLPAASA